MNPRSNINKRAFIEIFLIPELKSIIGYKKMLMLIFILFISLVVIGIGNGSKEYLKEKMNDPVIRFIDVEIPSRFSANLREEMLDRYRDKNSQIQWDYTGPYPLSIDYLAFEKTDNSNVILKGTILDKKDPFYEHMSKTNENILSSDFELYENNFGIIVTENFLKELGYEDDPKTKVNELLNISHIKYYDKSEKFSVFIPVTGIVKKLRKQFEFMLSHYCYNYLVTNFDAFGFQDENSRHAEYQRFFIFNPSEKNIEELNVLGLEPIEDISIAHNGQFGVLFESKQNNEDILKKVKQSNPKALRVYDFFKTSLPEKKIIKGSDDFYLEKLIARLKLKKRY